MTLRHHGNFGRFWAAEAVSDVGSYIRLLALQILIIQNLHGNAFDLGLVNAARWLPYLLMGLLAGAVLDRVNRRSVLVLTDFLLVLLYAAIGILAYVGYLDVGWLMGMVFLAGSAALFHEAASQSYLPELIPSSLLLRANARLEQTGSLAQTIGPAAAGAIIAAIGAPLAVMCDAVAHAGSGVFNSLTNGLRPTRPTERPADSRMGHEMREGLQWLYRHPTLRVLAWNTNLWFLFHSMVITVLVPFALHQLGLSPWLLGLVLAGAGLGSFLGTLLSGYFERWCGIGRAISVARWIYAPSLILVVLSPSGAAHAWNAGGFSLVAGGELLYGLAMGIEGPLEMAYRQVITPLRLQGRINTTMRATNRTMVVIGSPLGGAMALAFGVRVVLGVAVVGMAAVAVWYFFSPTYGAELPAFAPGKDSF